MAVVYSRSHVSLEPSIHRKCLLRLSKSLDQKEINELLYLSEDFIPQSEVTDIQSGVDLVRSLEKHGRLGPRNYSYLTHCLVEIGRVDLAQKLDPSQMEGTLPRHVIRLKQSVKRELEQMSRSATLEVWVGETLQQLSIQLEFSNPLKVRNTNQTLKAATKLISSAIEQSGRILEEVKHDRLPRLTNSTSRMERLEEDLSTALSNSPLQSTTSSNTVEPVERFKNKHPLSEVANNLYSSLSELLHELYGETEVRTKLKELEESLGAVKSLLHTNAHICFGFLSLIHITDTVASNSTEVLDKEAQEIIESFVLGFPEGAIITVSKHTLAALEGTAVLEALKEDKALDILFNSNPPKLECPCKANKCLRFGLLTVLLTLYKSASLTQSDWRSIQSRIMQQFRENLSEPTKSPFLEIDTVVMNSLERLFKHFSSSTLTDLSDLA